MIRLKPPVPICDDAEFSPDGLERLWLSRKVAETGPVGLFIGLNPSTAGATVDTNDHTITKECEFARRFGWSGFWKVNIFTCIETYSANLKSLAFVTAVGLHGDAVLRVVLPLAQVIVVCWSASVPKNKLHRIRQVEEMLRELAPEAALGCFGLSKDGYPVHPLRLSYDTRLVPYELPVRTSLRDE